MPHVKGVTEFEIYEEVASLDPLCIRSLSLFFFFSAGAHVSSVHRPTLGLADAA